MQAIADPPAYHRARAAVRFDEVARKLVHAFKYGDRLYLAPTLGRWMARRRPRGLGRSRRAGSGSTTGAGCAGTSEPRIGRRRPSPGAARAAAVRRPSQPPTVQPRRPAERKGSPLRRCRRAATFRGALRTTCCACRVMMRRTGAAERRGAHGSIGTGTSASASPKTSWPARAIQRPSVGREDRASAYFEACTSLRATSSKRTAARAR